ncbi:hypothetical protein AXF42_Ash016915 [Apostasia shenzhenica]|uniref:J domain-containing protein n=1 Tax=Apostasia shenzhenica TaxID=1088818 RepID=A0A2H9ZRH7_9ASPA|nr:hypothetical protein AXF42_Ash016915 [Apostasia shenzhenica]
MNHTLRPSFIPCPAASLSFRAACFFHSSPVLERKGKPYWNYGKGSYSSKRFNIYTKRAKRMEAKRTLLRNISEYAEYLFQSWREDDNSTWFRRQYWSKGAKVNGFGSHEPVWARSRSQRKVGFDLCTSDDDDDDGVDNIFQSAFGGKYYYYSSSSCENSKWRASFGYTGRKSSSYYTDETDDETNEDTGCDTFKQSDLASERLTLGLSASGPLKLEEVKTAYRACALRWHPDRHQGSSKAMAEEKFKHCSAAYKSLCNRIATN